MTGCAAIPPQRELGASVPACTGEESCVPKPRLAASAEPVELEFKYALSDLAVDEFVAETGKMPELIDGVVVAFTDLDADLRRRAAMIRVAVLQQYELIDED